MATKYRRGLYGVSYIVDNHNLIEFTIERNSGELNTKIGNWIVTEHIGSDIERWDTEFATKGAALEAIADHMNCGTYRHITGYGWCYILFQEEKC